MLNQPPKGAHANWARRMTASEQTNFQDNLVSNNSIWPGHIQQLRPGLTLFAGHTASGKSTAMALSAEVLQAARPSATFSYLGDHFYLNGADALQQPARTDVVLVDELRTGPMCLDVFKRLQEGQTVWATIHAGTREDALYRFENLLMQSFDMHVQAMADFSKHVKSEFHRMVASGGVTVIQLVRQTTGAAS